MDNHQKAQHVSPVRRCLHCDGIIDEPHTAVVGGHKIECPCTCHDRKINPDEIGYIKQRLAVVSEHRQMPPDLTAQLQAALDLIQDIRQMAKEGARQARRQKVRSSCLTTRHRMIGTIRVCKRILATIERGGRQ